MPSILLVRHAQASYGAAVYDLLSLRGHTQVKLLDAELRRQELKLTHVGAGSMRRQQQTAQPIALSAGSDVIVDARFNECDASDVLGAYSKNPESLTPGDEDSGISSEAFQALLDPAFGSWITAGAGSAASESWPEFVDRVLSALHGVASSLASGDTALVATSGGVVAALCVRLLDLPDNAFIALNRVAVNAGISKVAVGRRGMGLISYNEHGYLATAQRSLITYR